MFKVGDKVVGNSYNWFHRIGCNGTIESIDECGLWVRWSDGDLLLSKEGGLDIVSRAPQPEPIPPRKMHPDDFVNAVNDFALDNGFLGITSIEFGSPFNNGFARHSYYV